MKLRVYGMAASLAAGLWLAGCGDETTETAEQLDPTELKPPLGLQAIPGDGKVYLVWQSANSDEDSVEFGGFAVYQAEGDQRGAVANAEAAAPFAAEHAAFDALYGDNAFDCPDGPGETCNGMAAVKLLVKSDGPASGLAGGAGVEAIAVEVPGVVSFTLEGGSPVVTFNEDGTIPGLGGDEGDGGEPAARLAPTQATGVTDPVAEGEVALSNGALYSFLVTTRAGDELQYESWTSNIAITAARAESGELTIVAGGATDGLDVDGMAVADFSTHDANYDESPLGASDLVVEQIADFYTNGMQNYFAGANGAAVQDLGAGAWEADTAVLSNNKNEAPTAGYIGNGKSVLVVAGHLYAVQLADGSFAKVHVAANDAAAGSVTVHVAHQTGADAAAVFFKQ